MKNELSKVMNKFYHDMAIVELNLQNKEMISNKLTYNSMLYLDIILAHSGEYTASNIADMLHVSRPSVTQKINELEKMGYITKKQSSSDKRVFYLHFNEREAAEKFIDNYEKLDKKILGKMKEKYSDKDIDKFLNMLSFVSQAFLEETK